MWLFRADNWVATYRKKGDIPMITNTRTNFKANTRYEIEYSYFGFDKKTHWDISVVRGRDEADAKRTLSAILGRDPSSLHIYSVKAYA